MPSREYHTPACPWRGGCCQGPGSFLKQHRHATTVSPRIVHHLIATVLPETLASGASEQDAPRNSAESSRFTPWPEQVLAQHRSPAGIFTVITIGASGKPAPRIPCHSRKASTGASSACTPRRKPRRDCATPLSLHSMRNMAHGPGRLAGHGRSSCPLFRTGKKGGKA